MIIRENVPGRRAYRNYSSNTKAVAKNLEKLSTGYKINRAADDAAGLAISEKMRAEITGLARAESNAKEGIYLVQTAEGALEEMHEMARRLLELAEQSSNGTYDDDVDRYQLQKEVESIKGEFDRISESTNFNKIFMLKTDSVSAPWPVDGVYGGSIPADPAIPEIGMNDGRIEFATDPLFSNQTNWSAPSVSSTDGIEGRSLDDAKEPTFAGTARQSGGSYTNLTVLDGSMGGTNAMQVRSSGSLWSQTVNAAKQDDINSALSGMANVKVKITWDHANGDNYNSVYYKAEFVPPDAPLSFSSGSSKQVTRSVSVPKNESTHAAAEFTNSTSLPIYANGVQMGSFNFSFLTRGTPGQSTEFVLTKNTNGTQEKPAESAKTTVSFTGNGVNWFNGKIKLGADGADGKFQFVGPGGTADSGYTKVELSASDNYNNVASKLRDVMASSSASSKYTFSYQGSGTLRISRKSDDTTTEPPAVSFEKGAYDGKKADTEVSFAGRTGANIVNGILVLGPGGSQGKYQFVTADTPDEAVAEGCKKIVISTDDDAAHLAAAAAAALSASADEDFPGFEISADGGKLHITEKEVGGLAAVKATVEQITGGRPAETVVNFSGATAALMHGRQMSVGSYGDKGLYQFVYDGEDTGSGAIPIVIERGDDDETIARRVREAVQERGVAGFDILNGTGTKLVIRESENRGDTPIPVSVYSRGTSVELLKSLRDHGAIQGKLNFSLGWKDGSDLDMVCTWENGSATHKISAALDSSGNSQRYAYYNGYRYGRVIGALQYDANYSASSSYSATNPSEYIYYTDPQSGKYTISITKGDGPIHANDAEESDVKFTYFINGESHEESFTMRTGEQKSFVIDFNANALSVPSVDMSAGVRASAVKPITVGTPALTTADFSGLFGKQLYGSTMQVTYNESPYDINDTYQFVERAEYAMEGCIGIVLDPTDNDSTIAEKVRASLMSHTRPINDFRAYSENGVFKWQERDPLAGRRAIQISCRLVTDEELSRKNYGQKGEDLYHIRLMIGTTKDSYNWVEVPRFNMHATAIGLGEVDVSTQTKALNSITEIKDTVNYISDVRGKYGAIQNRLEHAVNNLSSARVVAQDAESAIRDTDVAEELMQQTKNNILMQTSEIMLSQASKQPEQVLSLLQQ